MFPSALIGADENVGRFEIAVDDSALVGMMNRARNIHHQPGDRGLVSMKAIDVTVETRTLDQLHGQEGLATAILDVEHTNDIRMLQPRHALSLAAESLCFSRPREVSRWARLQGHPSLQAPIKGPIHDSHGALTNA